MKEILNLYDLSDKANDIISPIYDQLNDDSLVLSMFVEVLEKTTTEQDFRKGEIILGRR